MPGRLPCARLPGGAGLRGGGPARRCDMRDGPWRRGAWGLCRAPGAVRGGACYDEPDLRDLPARHAAAGLPALADPALVPAWLSGMSSGPAGEDDPRRLACEWLLADYLEINGGCASVVRFDLVAMGQVTRLTVDHRGLDPGGSLLKVLTPGWPVILSSLKSLAETGEPPAFGQSG